MLPAVVNGIYCDALPDSMSTENIMSREYARRIGAALDRRQEKRRVYTNACGNVFSSIGEVVADVAFPDEPSKIWRNCRFSVVENCAAAVIMGDAFLRSTETLTRFRHRLKRLATSSLKNLWRLCYMDVPRRLLSCSVDGRVASAAADTGSDIDLVSYDYARRRQWFIYELPKDTGYVVLADRSVKKVTGYVEVLLGISGAIYSKTFFVLEGLISDVLLGDSTLDEIDAFNRYKDYFVETMPGDAGGICHNINWQDTIDQRLEEILRENFPRQTAADLGQRRFNRIGLRLAPSTNNIRGKQAFPRGRCTIRTGLMRQAWNEAFARARRRLDDREVTARGQAARAMQQLDGADLREAERRDRQRREQHRQKTDRVKQEWDRFLGLASSTS
jgi:hypothetical protein